MYESFTHREHKEYVRDVQGYDDHRYSIESEHTCMVFETLGKSLYEFIKGNRYYGFALYQIQNIAR